MWMGLASEIGPSVVCRLPQNPSLDLHFDMLTRTKIGALLGLVSDDMKSASGFSRSCDELK